MLRRLCKERELHIDYKRRACARSSCPSPEIRRTGKWKYCQRLGVASGGIPPIP